MFRIRLIVLGLFAMLALSAIGATSAMAADPPNDSFTVSKNPIKAHQTQTQKFVTNAGAVECKKATFEASPAIGEHSTIETTSVVYSECKAFGVAATINFEGCQYKFNEPTDSEEESTMETNHTGTVDIVCPTGKTIVIKAGTCTVTVPGQKGLGVINYKLIGTENTVIEPKVTGITYTEIGEKCPNLKKAEGTFTNGTYGGNVEAEGVMIN